MRERHLKIAGKRASSNTDSPGFFGQAHGERGEHDDEELGNVQSDSEDYGAHREEPTGIR